MKIGFIGTGSMGKMLVEAFLASKALEPQQIIITNRTFDKAKQLADSFPGVIASRSNKEVTEKSNVVFICVKPLEYKDVLAQIKSSLLPEHIIVSITSPVLIAHLEEELDCKIAKVIPSITNSVCSGASLCMFSNRMTACDKQLIEQLFSNISNPLAISENHTRIVSDISSCGPAFFSFLLEKFIEAAVSETAIERDEAEQIAGNMLLGTGMLLTEGKLSTAQIQERVAVPGGITAKALDLLREDTAGMFEKLIQTTHEKYYEDLHKVTEAFYKKEVNGP